MITNNTNISPALVPPPGSNSNFVDPYSLEQAFDATALLCLLLATLAVALRFAVGLCRSPKRIRVEEYTCVISWLGLVLTCVMTALEIHKGLGRHQWNVPEANIQSLSKLLYFNRIFYSPTILAAKATVLLQLMRIFVPTKRGIVFRAVQIMIWLNICFYLANVLSVIFQCNPVRKAWDTTTTGACIDTNLNFVITGVINVISDVLILLLPLWTIWHLKLPMQKKLTVSAAFATGVFANFAGIMRLRYSVQLLHTPDLTFVRLQHGMWTIAEITTTIICSSLPLFPQFLLLFREKRKTFISAGSMISSVPKARGNYSSIDPRRDDIEMESGSRPPRYSSESYVWEATMEKEKQVSVTERSILVEEPSSVALLERK